MTRFVVLAFASVGVVMFIASAGGPARADAVQAHDFVGSERCRACHAEAYDTWRKGPHSRALAGLSDKDRRDLRCRQCHTMAPDVDDARLEGVQCETCHGPGRYYSEAYVMRDADLRSHLLYEVPSEKTCVRCHTESAPNMAPFSYEAALERIRHWRPKPAPDAAPAPSADDKAPQK